MGLLGVARLQLESGFVDSFRHSPFGLAYRWAYAVDILAALRHEISFWGPACRH